MRTNYLYSMGHKIHKKGFKRFSKLFDFFNYLLHNSYLPSKSEIGKETIFAYGGIGIVIHERAVIGKHCVIGQGITIGGKSGSKGVPIIEDNVEICAGARILGEINIGHDSIIGANAVVVDDVEPYSVVAGVPAKIIDKITEDNFKKKYQYYYAPQKFLTDNVQTQK